MSIIQGNAHTSAGGGYQIERSLRFNSADSAYLNRTPASTGNRQTWTWSGWVKRGALGSAQVLFGSRPTGSSNESAFISFNSSNAIYIFSRNPSDVVEFTATTNAVFRDPSAWYHVLFYLDTTQSTSTNRMALYVNNVQQTFSTSTYPTQNLDCYLNQNVIHFLGSSFSDNYLNGYMTEVNFIGGQALTPSDFGETDSATGVWKPKAYSGTYGTNGFYLKFADNSGTTSTTLGKDSSGNGNNWTPNNFSVTAGAGNDSLVDSPTSYGTDTGAGGTVRGNYCTWNPFLRYSALTAPANGNLDISGNNANWRSIIGTIAATSGKWYAEFTVQVAGADMQVGVFDLNNSAEVYQICNTDNRNLTRTASGYAYQNNAKKINNNTETNYGATYTTNDVIGIALDLDGGTITFYKNGSSQGQAYSSLSGNFTFGVSTTSSNVFNANFGQRAFAYTAPSGFKALCTQNLPTPTIGATSTTQANDYFNPVLYTGTGSSLGVTGVGFQPDWTWIKGRSGATDHGLYDAVRGVQKQLESNTTTAETTETTGLTAFNSDGFTVGALAQLNTSSATYVAWNWKANGAGSSNTAGTITSTVSANTTSGFSIVTYTGTGSASDTVGHGLGVTPAMVITKRRSSGSGAFNWMVKHSSLASNHNLLLESTSASTNVTTGFGAGGIANLSSSTTFGFLNGTDGNPNNSNTNAATYVAYCFAAVAGYSAFGSYTGNGATPDGTADGPFIYTGFRPRYVCVKKTSDVSDWNTLDTSRNTYNVAQNGLYLNTADAQGSGDYIDILSNGFKIRDSGAGFNTSGGTYIYFAFAENPFKYSLAR